MSAPFAWLPERMRPRETEQTGRGARDLRAIETTALVLIAIVLAVATINDVVRQAGINHRLVADLRTWRRYTGHDYHSVGVDQNLLGPSSKQEVVCGNDAPGPPKARVQVCLVVEGPTRRGVRTVVAGWRLPAHVQEDEPSKRYGCFGPEGARFCPR